MKRMPPSHGQFCPVAKASEIFATRWTPLIVRELIAGARSFNDIHRGVPLMSRAVLVVRLRQLEAHGIIRRRSRGPRKSHDYCLTPSGEGLREVTEALGRWGMNHGLDKIKPSDLDPALLVWGLRRRIDVDALPDRRFVLRFEFSGVPANRTQFRLMWLIIERPVVDVCSKDPGFSLDLTIRGNIRDWVQVYLGKTPWSVAARTVLRVEGDGNVTKALPTWMQFER